MADVLNSNDLMISRYNKTGDSISSLKSKKAIFVYNKNFMVY